MRIITKCTLAVIAIMMTAVVPQNLQARTSGRSISPGNSFSRTIQTAPQQGTIAGTDILLTNQESKQIITKSTLTEVYIGSAQLSIPAPGVNPMYYTYSEASGSSVLEPTSSTTAYNVAVSMDAADGTLQIAFNDLKVTKSHQYNLRGNVATAAVYINCSNNTVITVAGKSSLTDAGIASNKSSSGLFSAGVTTIQCFAPLEATGQQASNYSSGLYDLKDLTIDLDGGSLTATASEVSYLSSGLNSEGQLSIKGSGAIVATGGVSDWRSSGIYASGNISVNLTGGSLLATGVKAKKESNGLYSNQSMTVNGNGTIQATAGTAESSYGMNVPNGSLSMDLTGGSLTATGGEDADQSYGLSALQMSIKGNSTIIAAGSHADLTVGIYTQKNLNVELTGGSLKVSGGTLPKDGSYGLWVGSIDIVLGIVTIQGFTQAIYGSSVVPNLYTGSEIQAGTEYDGSNAGDFNPDDIANYKYLHVGNSILLTSVDAIPDQYANGEPITPKTVVRDGLKTLVEGTDYTLSYENNTDPGMATVTITGIGDYLDTQKTVTFLIMGDLSNSTVDGIHSNYDFTGSAITPVPSVMLGGKKLTEGTDYTVSYSNNIYPGTATVTITGIGDYFKGIKTVDFMIEEAMTDYAYVNLPSVKGISTNPVAGTYAVTKGNSFTFTITLKEGYGESQPIVMANRQVINPNEKGEYVIDKINENTDITITGITATAIEKISAKTVIRTNGHSLMIRTIRPQQLQVISILGKVAVLRNIPAGDTSIDTLSAGIYIVRLADGTIEKVIIR